MRTRHIAGRGWTGVMVVVMVIMGTGSLSGEMIEFTRISDNAFSDVAGQLSATVSMVDATHVEFEFFNSAQVASSITMVYFDDGIDAMFPILLDELTSIMDMGTIFEEGGSPDNLPAGNSISPQFSSNFTFTSANQPPTRTVNGVDQMTDSVTLVFLLAPSKTFADVVDGLTDGTLRIGLHVQGITDIGSGDNDQSDSFVNVPVPEPVSMLLMAGGAGMLMLRRRRGGKRAA